MPRFTTGDAETRGTVAAMPSDRPIVRPDRLTGPAMTSFAAINLTISLLFVSRGTPSGKPRLSPSTGSACAPPQLFQLAELLQLLFVPPPVQTQSAASADCAATRARRPAQSIDLFIAVSPRVRCIQVMPRRRGAPIA